MHVVYSILMGLKNTILSLLTGGLAGIGVTLFLMSAGPMLPWFPVILVAMAAVVYQVGGGARKTDDDIAIDASPPTTSPSVTQLMDAIPAPLVLLESDRSVAHANPTATAYLGTSLDQLLGTTLDAAAEGSLAPVSGPSHALRIGSGSPQIVVCLARDEPAPAEDLLREITRQRDDALEDSISKSLFVMGMEHELRSPLNAMLGYSEMLLEETEDMGRHDMSRDLTRVLVAGHHLLDRITGLVAVAKLDAGHLEIFNEEFSVQELVMDLKESVEALANDNNNRLEVRASLEHDLMCTDRLRLGQALGHLLNNACRFTTRGLVTLEVSVDDSYAEGHERLLFTITDNGVGMSPAQLEAAFGARNQDLPAFRRDRNNTGLGVLISCRFLYMLGGTLDVRSVPNEGTSIRLSLPRVPQAATDTGLSGDESDISASIGPVSAARAEHGMMLVISEYDDDLAERRDELAPVGFSLASATNGQEALTIARDMEPSVILLDAGMPGLKSWAMLNRLKQEPTMAEIPVVLFSTDESGERGLCLGPVDFIQKPLAPNDLLRVINRTLQGSASGTILVIDDDIAVREWIRGNLLTSGWKIQTAHGGPDAMKMIWNQRPALVIADLLMPRMDGFEFLTTLRARAAMRQLPVVLMSSIDLDKPRQDELGTRLLRTLAINAQPRDEWLGDVRSAIMAATRGQ